MLFDDNKHRFHFQCKRKTCQAVFSAEFDDPKDIQDIRDEELYLECECGEKAILMWD